MECENELLSKELQLESVLIALEEKNQDVKSLDLLIQMKCDELEVKEKQYAAIEMSIKAKEAESDCIQKSISEASKKLILLEKVIDEKSKEADSNIEELVSIRGMLGKLESERVLKQCQLNILQKSFEDWSKELELKKEHLIQCQRSIDDSDKEIKLKEKKLDSILNSILECSEELKQKEKQLDFVQKMKEDNLESLRKSREQYPHKFEIKERKLQSLVKELELKEELLGSGFVQLDLIYKKVNDCLMEVDLKDKNSSLQQGSIENSSSELEIKESEFLRKVNKLKLALEEFELIRKSTELGLKEVKIEQMEPSCQSCMTKEKNDLYGATSSVGMNGQALSSQPAICTVDKGPDAAESIKKLIQMGEIIHAVRHICVLKLTDKFSPVPLLIEYLEDAQNYTTLFCRERKSSEAKKKVLDKEVAFLGAVMECIRDCNLESMFPSKFFLKRIAFLEYKSQAFSLEVEGKKRPLDQLSQQGNVKSPWITKGNNVLTKPPGGCVKMNFCFAGKADCGFLSVVARTTNDMVLAIWCKKIPRSDPLEGEALAAHGALTLASSSGWEDIILEGNSEEVIGYLEQSREPISTPSRAVSELVGLFGSFKSAVPICVTCEANIMAHNVSQWAARNNVQDGPSWMSVPSSLFYIFS